MCSITRRRPERREATNAREGRPRDILWLVGAALVLLACGQQPGAGATAPSPTQAIAFPQRLPNPNEPPGGPAVGPAGLLSGKLAMEKGCLRVEPQDSGASYLPIWPPDFRLDTTGEHVRVLNGAGDIVARVGDKVRVGGGEAVPEVSTGPCEGPYWNAFEISAER